MIQVPPGRSLLAGSRDWPVWLATAAVIFLVAALFSIWLGRRHSRKAKVIWTVIILLVPILGPIAWALLGRERRRVR